MHICFLFPLVEKLDVLLRYDFGISSAKCTVVSCFLWSRDWTFCCEKMSIFSTPDPSNVIKRFSLEHLLSPISQCYQVTTSLRQYTSTNKKYNSSQGLQQNNNSSWTVEHTFRLPQINISTSNLISTNSCLKIYQDYQTMIAVTLILIGL